MHTSFYFSMIYIVLLSVASINAQIYGRHRDCLLDVPG